jgi:hypothetical protein
VNEGRDQEGTEKMFGYEATVLMMVGKAIDAEKLATAQRERVLNEQSRMRRPRRDK